MAVSALRWFKAALLLQILLLAYWLAKEVIDLFPWNDLAARPEDYDIARIVAVYTLPQLALIAIFALGIRVLAWVSVLGHGVMLALQLWKWWPVYVFGADAARREEYAASFGRTLKLLPSPGNHLPPDAQHIALHLLMIVTLAATAVATAKMRHL